MLAVFATSTAFAKEMPETHAEPKVVVLNAFLIHFLHDNELEAVAEKFMLRIGLPCRSIGRNLGPSAKTQGPLYLAVVAGR